MSEWGKAVDSLSGDGDGSPGDMCALVASIGSNTMAELFMRERVEYGVYVGERASEFRWTGIFGTGKNLYGEVLLGLLFKTRATVEVEVEVAVALVFPAAVRDMEPKLLSESVSSESVKTARALRTE